MIILELGSLSGNVSVRLENSGVDFLIKLNKDNVVVIILEIVVIINFLRM